ncbi:hypothetical protein AA3271_1020 [Gluconobacter japonicus NBRC 3271]|nr:hypothetical protein AA3271_1020 [Gluconobacter japonicus NBRC 3271]
MKWESGLRGSIVPEEKSRASCCFCTVEDSFIATQSPTTVSAADWLRHPGLWFYRSITVLRLSIVSLQV